MKIAKKIYTVMCDDARSEVGGKISLIGIYIKDILFNEIPAIYPKLCFVLFLGGLKELFTDVKAILNVPESEDIVLKMKKPPDAKLNNNMVLTWVISPFRVKVTGQARFSIYFDDAKKPSLSHNFEIKLIQKK